MAKEKSRKQEQYTLNYLENLKSTQNVGKNQNDSHMASYKPFIPMFTNSPDEMTYIQSYSFDPSHLNLIKRNILDFSKF